MRISDALLLCPSELFSRPGARLYLDGVLAKKGILQE